MEYDELKKKYSLPSFDRLNNEFEIYSLDKEFILRGIKKKMEERIDYLSSLLSEILQPSPESMPNMYECKFFMENDKEEVLKIFRSLQYFSRSLAESNIALDDDIDAKLICEIAEAFPKLRKDALPFLKKLKDVWKLKPDMKEVLEYFG